MEASVAEVENRILHLIEKGIEVRTRNGADGYAEAGRFHDQAVTFSTIPYVHPVFRAVAQTEVIHDLRQAGVKPEHLLESLEHIAAEHADVLDTGVYSSAFFGKGRIMEESAVLKRLFGGDHPYETLQRAWIDATSAASFYALAIRNRIEQFPNEYIRDHQFRVIGIGAAILHDLSEITVGDERDKNLRLAETLAVHELTARQARGEETGYGIMNAHLTLGMVLTASFSNGHRSAYRSANRNLVSARDLATKEADKTQIQARIGWLVYVAGGNGPIIESSLNEVLRAQECSSSEWDPGAKLLMYDKLTAMAEATGGDFPDRMSAMYPV